MNTEGALAKVKSSGRKDDKGETGGRDWLESYFNSHYST